MRPAHVYASMSAQQHTELITALHGPWRTATRMVIVVLSAAGMSPSEIADLLHYDPKTVRTWIARHRSEGITGLPDRPRSGRPRKGSRRLGERIHTLLQTPKAWTTTRIWRALGRPAISLSTMRRRIREQARWARPRLIAKSDPNRDSICTTIRERITALPAGSVVLAEDETHIDLLARVRACWMPTGLRHRILTPGTNVRRTVHGAVNCGRSHPAERIYLADQQAITIRYHQARTLDEKNAALQDLLDHADTHGPLIDEVIKYQADHGNFAKPPTIAAVTSDDEPPAAPIKRRSSRTREPQQ
ncbi:hypothetical protein Ato02nite_025000 [Paractinoplanes toevensis]|uniref:Transposase n=1 Tax=Paractinoplanes toevensis TaxID=571911 RepID=A0A919VZZ7_9ACTN|nr:hypothetical protein Ato02nite_025000 [Actinoplanes toevensis]